MTSSPSSPLQVWSSTQESAGAGVSVPARPSFNEWLDQPSHVAGKTRRQLLAIYKTASDIDLLLMAAYAGGAGACVPAQSQEAHKAALLVLCALEKANDWHPNMAKDIAFAIEATRTALGVAGTEAPSLTEEEREHIHQAIDKLGDYEHLRPELRLETSRTRGVLQKLFRFLPSRAGGVGACVEASKEKPCSD